MLKWWCFDLLLRTMAGIVILNVRILFIMEMHKCTSLSSDILKHPLLLWTFLGNCFCVLITQRAFPWWMHSALSAQPQPCSIWAVPPAPEKQQSPVRFMTLWILFISFQSSLITDFLGSFSKALCPCTLGKTNPPVDSSRRENWLTCGEGNARQRLQGRQLGEAQPLPQCIPLVG